MKFIVFVSLIVLSISHSLGQEVKTTTKANLKKLNFDVRESKILLKNSKSVVLLQVEDKKKNFMACNAFLVQKKGRIGIFLTNAHCFTARHLRGKLTSSISLKNPSGGKRTFKKCKKVLKRDDFKDLALLSCPIPSRSSLIPLQFEKEESQIERNQELFLLHQNCYASGCKEKNENNKLHKFKSLISLGRFLHYEWRKLHGVAYAKSRPGSSGAPVFDRETLNVIGVLQAGDERFGETQFITLGVVLDFLSRNKIKLKF